SFLAAVYSSLSLVTLVARRKRPSDPRTVCSVSFEVVANYIRACLLPMMIFPALLEASLCWPGRLIRS
ncbi:MAG: hypothetical protein QGD96_07575, partial [Anaerolineae bacterium]|nr:hypothetical protein [Anaerolineae bacterium]